MFSELVRAIWLVSMVVMVPGTLSASKAFSSGTCDGPGSGVGALTVTCCGVGGVALLTGFCRSLRLCSCLHAALALAPGGLQF